jgi:hypothetical protein
MDVAWFVRTNLSKSDYKVSVTPMLRVDGWSD